MDLYEISNLIFSETIKKYQRLLSAAVVTGLLRVITDVALLASMLLEISIAPGERSSHICFFLFCFATLVCCGSSLELMN